MAKENKTKYVILGLLLDQSLSGYEIREITKESTAYFWQESDASIYPTLKLLKKEGKVVSETRSVGKRKKEIFTITEKGQKAFASWFSKPPEPSTHRHEFLLKLFFTTEETKSEMEKHFERKLRQLQEGLDQYKQIEKQLEKEFPHKTFWMKTLQNGIAHAELEIAWLKNQKKRNLK